MGIQTHRIQYKYSHLRGNCRTTFLLKTSQLWLLPNVKEYSGAKITKSQINYSDVNRCLYVSIFEI